MVSSGTTALHLGVRMLGWGAGDEVVTSPFSFVASANCLLYEGAKPVFADVEEETLDLDPAAAAEAVGERTAGILPVHIFGYPAAMPELEALAASTASASSRTPARRSARSTPRAAGRRPRQPRHLRLLRQQADDDGGGGDDRPPRRRRGGAPALGAQPGPRRRHGLARPRSPRLQLPPLRPRRGARRRPGREARLAAGAPARAVAAMYEERPRGARGRRARRSPAAAPRCAAGSSTRSASPAGVDRDATIARLGERGIASKAYLPCIHLFPHLRELGYREGQFPVAEAAAADSLALPFFPAMSEAQVERVCQELAAALGRANSRHNRRPMARFRKDPDPRFWRLNRSLAFDWRLAPYDIDQSRAHARGLRGIGVLDEDELAQIEAGLERVHARMAEHGFEFDPGRRGHPHGDRAPARRGDRAAGRQAPHRPLAQRPGRDRRRDGRPGALAAGDRALRGGDGAPAGAGRVATATGRCPATPTCSAPSRSTSATTCSPTSGCSPATCCASSSRSTAPA